MNGTQWSDLFFNLSISLLGGLVKCLTSDRKKKGFGHFAASAIVGGFAGLLMYMLCMNFGFSWQMTSFATGVAGYMGDSILELFSSFLPKLLSGKFKISLEDENDNDKDKNKSKSKK